MKKILFISLFSFLCSTIFAQTQIGDALEGSSEHFRFGYSVSLSNDGNKVAIGSYRGSQDRGAVQVFERVGDTFLQIGNEIIGDNLYDGFGSSVHIIPDGNTLIIGMPFAPNGDPSYGGAKVYTLENSNWIQVGNTIYGKHTYDNAGRDVKISSNGQKVAIGANSADYYQFDTGHARVYELSNGVWNQLGNDINGSGENDHFGNAIAFTADGNRIAVGAPFNDENGDSSGHVKIFDFDGTNWIQKGSTIFGDYESAQSGVNVSFDNTGNRLAIGAPGVNTPNGVGYVKILDWYNGTWQQIGTNITSGDIGDFFGSGMELDGSGNYIVAAAALGELYGHEFGYLRMFRYQNDNWTQIGEDMVGENEEDRFGYPCSMSKNGQVIVGSSHWNDTNGNNTGYVRLFDVNTLNIGEVASTFAEILFYPNPAQEDITFSNPNKISIEKMLLYDSQGRLIYSLQNKDIIDNKIPLENINSGIYVLKLETENGTVSSQIIIE